MINRWSYTDRPAATVTAPELLPRIGVRPPYFALTDMALAGIAIQATAVAESPAFQEAGPMPAAELGRHAAIVGLSLAAFQQDDENRRYYLARRAACRYTPNEAPYGTPVKFTGQLLGLDKRSARAAVRASTAGAALASFEIDYTVLTSSAFERLFRIRGRLTPHSRSPYGSLLTASWQGTPDLAEQVVDELPVDACVGHFDGYPALPVAVLMGQLSYLAGRLHDGPYRVVRGDVAASDLIWAGERAHFRVVRDGISAEGDTRGTHRYRCEAWADDRSVATMTLWLTSVDEGLAH